jgi:hypothetical protein
LVHSDKINKSELIKEFCEINNISSINGLDYRKLYQYTEDFIAFLELKGFTKLKTYEVLFCD